MFHFKHKPGLKRCFWGTSLLWHGENAIHQPSKPLPQSPHGFTGTWRYVFWPDIAQIHDPPLSKAYQYSIAHFENNHKEAHSGEKLEGRIYVPNYKVILQFLQPRNVRIKLQEEAACLVTCRWNGRILSEMEFWPFVTSSYCIWSFNRTRTTAAFITVHKKFMSDSRSQRLSTSSRCPDWTLVVLHCRQTPALKWRVSAFNSIHIIWRRVWV